MKKPTNSSLRAERSNPELDRHVANAPRDDDKDIFNTRWIIIGVIIAALVIPFLTGCGVKGDLKRAPAQEQE